MAAQLTEEQNKEVMEMQVVTKIGVIAQMTNPPIPGNNSENIQ